MAAVTVSGRMNQFFDRTQKVLQTTQKECKYREIEAAIQLRQAVENARVVYANCSTIIENSDDVLKTTIHQLEELVIGAEERNKDILSNLAARSQKIGNSLPFQHTCPQMASVTPRFVLRTDETPIVLKFIGNFEHAHQPSNEPCLTFNKQKIAATVASRHQLEFNIPLSTVFPNKSSFKTQEIIFSEGTLEVPYPTSSVEKTVAVFTATLAALPPSPGDIKFHYSIDRIVREEQRKASAPDFCSSRREFGNNDMSKNFYAYPTPGWRIHLGSHSACILEWDGDDNWGPACVSAHEQCVTYHGKTQHHGRGTSGHMKVCIGFTEWQDVTVTDHFSREFELKWGSTFKINYPLGKWRVEYQGFEGTEHTFVESNITSSPYLKIEHEGAGFIIKAIKPPELEEI